MILTVCAKFPYQEKSADKVLRATSVPIGKEGGGAAAAAVAAAWVDCGKIGNFMEFVTITTRY